MWIWSWSSPAASAEVDAAIAGVELNAVGPVTAAVDLAAPRIVWAELDTGRCDPAESGVVSCSRRGGAFGMNWSPLTATNVVEVLTVACEHAIFDFKQRYDIADATVPFEIAKDATAFTNHLGGTIAVGVIEGSGERRGRAAQFAPLTAPTPGQLIAAVDRAIKLYCLPVPIVDAVEIPLTAEQVAAVLGRLGPATSIVAINVQPSLNTPVGCSVCDKNGTKIDHAWRFPVRTIESARFLRPEEIAMTMNVNERKALLQLQQLTGEAKLTVWFNTQAGTRGVSRPCRIVALDPQIMICTLQMLTGDDEKALAEIPLTFVRACWQTTVGWNVAIDGIAFEMDPRGRREQYYPPGGLR